MLTVAASLVAWPLGLGPIYGVTAIVVGALFLAEAIRLVGRSRRGEPLKPMRLFHWSTTYLTILFIAVAVDALRVAATLDVPDLSRHSSITVG